ncbi:hypothetical protein Zmor_018107 [Zophobas morio]|uniref:Uncharacterized protein n=1 Tax=Zophobas morio TaxID=2755281 RepID=A0AA38I9W2_9CUCU|nr:hypothetical protein Zmor_018107 [Zophobas morio]
MKFIECQTVVSFTSSFLSTIAARLMVLAVLPGVPRSTCPFSTGQSRSATQNPAYYDTECNTCEFTCILNANSDTAASAICIVIVDNRKSTSPFFCLCVATRRCFLQSKSRRRKCAAKTAVAVTSHVLCTRRRL